MPPPRERAEHPIGRVFYASQPTDTGVQIGYLRRHTKSQVTLRDK